MEETGVLTKQEQIKELYLVYPVSTRTGKREPNDFQRKFHKLIRENKYTCACTGFGSGKTLAICMAILELYLQTPNGHFLLAAPTYPQLEVSVLKTFLEVCPKLLIKKVVLSPNPTVYMIYKGKEGRIDFRSCDDASKFQGAEYSAIGIDEGSLIKESVFTMLVGRLRDKHTPERLRKIIIATNPAGKNWVYKYFFKDPKPGFAGLKGTTFDNQDNLGKEYIDSMIAIYSADWVNRFVYGSFDSFVGQIFTDFNPEAHVIEPFQIPQHWNRFRAVDFGVVHPSAALWAAEDDEGKLYFYFEFEKAGIKADELAEEIKRISRGENYVYSVGDYAGKAMQQTSGTSPWRQLSDLGVQLSPAHKHDKNFTIQRAQQLFKNDRIAIFSSCKNLVDELLQYQWEKDTKTGDPKPVPLKVMDDLVDCFLYIIAGRPDMFPTPGAPKRKYSKDDMFNIAVPYEVIQEESPSYTVYY